MEQKNHIQLKKYLNKLVSGNINSQEKNKLRSYISSTFQDKELDKLMQQHWNEIGNKKLDKNDFYLQQLRSKIWEKIYNTKSKQNINWKIYFTRIASILFIPLLICSAFLFFHIFPNTSLDKQDVMQKIFATPGSRVHFVLPDNSEVWLNSGSTLEYPINLDKQKQRRVKLNGQGYFNVIHDKKHPFLVEAGELNIKVLGTSFDVSTYANDQFIYSTLEEGSIVLLNLKGNKIAKLIPGQKATLDKQTHKLFIENVDTRLTTSWKDGKLIFKNTPLKEVTKQLERWFNCSIQISPKLLNSNILYTATIKDETLGEVLKMIEISTSVKTKIENRKVNIWK